ncbi:unnamed protein product, partial [marine sediment metagenome]
DGTYKMIAIGQDGSGALVYYSTDGLTWASLIDDDAVSAYDACDVFGGYLYVTYTATASARGIKCYASSI